MPAPHRSLVFTVLLLTAVAAAPRAAHAQQPSGPVVADLPSVTLPSALDRVLRDYERHWLARDAAALAALFTPNGMALQDGQPPVRGRAAIAKALTPGDTLHLRALEFSADGTSGWIIGAYRWGSAKTDAGKFVLALSKDANGRWLIAGDIDNANRRARVNP